MLLTNCHTAFKTETVELLLASLIQSWSRVFVDRPIPAVFNEGHGREPWSSDIDISRTVGWFTALSPILVTPSEDPTDTVRKVKDFKRRIPGNGRPYFARRCLTDEGCERYKTHWPMEILFNYLGQYQVCIFLHAINRCGPMYCVSTVLFPSTQADVSACRPLPILRPVNAPLK
jgi:hypothetical protein